MWIRFFIKIALFVLILGSLYLFFVDKLANDYVDPHYYKFTQKAGGLILGLSRANEGISPYIVEEKLKPYFPFKNPLVNFAINESHFGAIYLRAIKQKIQEADSLVFVMSISPGNFSAPKGLDSIGIFEYDKQLTLGKVSNYTSNPNYNYIIKTYGAPLYNSLHDMDRWPHRISHKNGWNEIVLNNEFGSISDDDISHWKSLTIDFFNTKIKQEQLADYRYTYFIKTLEFLKTKGQVFLIRMPSDKMLLKFEKKHWQDFDIEMDSISKVYHIPYFNYAENTETYKTYDGSHLESQSAKQFSNVLANDIKTYLENNANRL